MGESLIWEVGEANGELVCFWFGVWRGDARRWGKLCRLAVWDVSGVGWRVSALVGVVGCGSNQGWFGGWWVAWVGRFYRGCVWGVWVGVGGSRR